MSFPNKITQYSSFDEYLLNSPDEYKFVVTKERIPQNTLFVPEKLIGMLGTIIMTIVLPIFGAVMLYSVSSYIWAFTSVDYLVKGDVWGDLVEMIVLSGIAGAAFYFAYRLFLQIQNYVLYKLQYLKIGLYFVQDFIIIRRDNQIVWTLPIDQIRLIQTYRYAVQNKDYSDTYFTVKIISNDDREWESDRLDEISIVRDVIGQIQEYCKSNQIKVQK